MHELSAGLEHTGRRDAAGPPALSGVAWRTDEAGLLSLSGVAGKNSCGLASLQH